MRSTRRSEAWAGLTALVFLAVAALTVALFLPPEPTAPRWRGAGNDTPRRGGTFVFHHEDNVRGFDPHTTWDELANMGIKLLYEGLIEYDRDTLEFVPRLAEALPEQSEDGRTFTFRLRRGVRFQDSEVFPGGRGRELTAEDVRWSLEHLLHPDTASQGASFYALIEGYDEYRAGHASHISGIRVRDRYTIEIRLSRPDQTFLNAMAMTFAYPVAREAYERWGDDDVTRHPVGTGAYMLESWEPGVEVVFVRNPNYFIPGRPYPDRMVFTLDLHRQAAVMRFRNGDLDHIHRQTVADYLKLRAMDEWAPYRIEEPMVDIWGVVMNTGLAPFDDVHVRRAVGFVINRPHWRHARANRLLIAGQPIPASIPGFDPELPTRQFYDLERAREEMRLAGHPNGLDEPVELWVGTGDIGRIYGELIQADLRAIGIQVEIKQVAFPIFLQETGKPRTVQLLFSGWSMDYPDPASFLDPLFHSNSIHDNDSTNRSFYSNPEVDRLLDEARVERDRERRFGLYRAAARVIAADAPWAFTLTNTHMEMWQPYVRDYRPHPVWNNFYRDLWLDLPRERWTAAPSLRSSPFAALAPFARMLR